MDGWNCCLFLQDQCVFVLKLWVYSGATSTMRRAERFAGARGGGAGGRGR